MNPHEHLDQRSLALGKAVADKIRHNPDLFMMGLDNVRRWIHASNGSPLPAHVE